MYISNTNPVHHQQLNALRRFLKKERQTERRKARLFAWRATDAPVPRIWCQSPDTDRLCVSHLRDNEIARATQTSADCTTLMLRQSLHLSETHQGSAKQLHLPPSSSDPDTRYERARLIKSPSNSVMERSGWKRRGRGAALHLIGFPSQCLPQVIEDVWTCRKENSQMTSL